MNKPRVLFLAAMLLAFLPFRAHAYVDPSVMSYTVQAVAGALIGLGAVAGIVWRMVKKRAQPVLDLDARRRKETEADVVVWNENSPDCGGDVDGGSSDR
ncbi:MAG: hypothetical protein HPZ91_15585 [Lentisphaeria bacterium]|nr:hypothetical protein [Lentisphaeria bacterium]